MTDDEYELLRERRIFNSGCDARLAGEPIGANPYRGDRQMQAWKFIWDRGWWDVDLYWGFSKGRWAVKPLVAVKERQIA